MPTRSHGSDTKCGNPRDCWDKHGPRQRSLCLTHFLRTSSAVTLTSACIAVLSPSNAFAKVRVCQEQEQHYEQIKEAAGPPELNAALSAAADKGCLNLARRLLGDGASLASRRIIFRVGSSLAVRSSPAAVSSRTPRLIRRVISNSWAISSRAKRLASSTMTVRTPLPSIRSSRAAKPARVSIGSAPETAAS